jgi:multidrug transporter EmrE-like cation transporter
MLLYLIFDHAIAGSLFIRRVFFVPAKLTFDYFNFFSINDFVWWSNSVLEGFIKYPYDFSVSKEIGQYNGSGSSANNGFISSGYAHAGLWGVAIYSFIFAYFIKALDSIVLNSDVPVWLALGMTIVPLRSALISSDFFTTMLTHGLALSFLMILLFRRSPHLLKSCSYKNA